MVKLTIPQARERLDTMFKAMMQGKEPTEIEKQILKSELTRQKIIENKTKEAKKK